MGQSHGARQQKKLAKQKSKRAEKRSNLARRNSDDPTVRLQQAADWPVTTAIVSATLWEDGIGALLLARKKSAGQILFAVFLVDVDCLGVKDAFWRAGTLGDLNEKIREIEEFQAMRPVAPAGLVKIVKGAVDYARSFGFAPHRDYHNAALLLDGIDPASYPGEFTYGRDGKPFYHQGPNESSAQASAIIQRVVQAGGDYVAELRADSWDAFGFNDDSDDSEDDDEGDSNIPAEQ
jgi:hypothetical protein